MLEAERSFRRIKGHRDMQTLVIEARAEIANRVAEKDGGSTIRLPPEQWGSSPKFQSGRDMLIRVGQRGSAPKEPIGSE
jgi:hypothetical protein